MSTTFKKAGIFRVPAEYRMESKHWEESREPFYSNVVKLAKLVMRAQGITITVEGSDNIPLAGGALLACNHTGYYDFILAGVPAELSSHRLVRFMTKQEIFKVPLIGSFMRAMKHIPVDRAAGTAAFNEAVAKLRDGQLVGIFPEATISRSFEIKDMKNGAVRIAKEADVPLIPMVIWGSQRIWTKDLQKNLGRSKTPIWVRVGTPIPLTGNTDADVETLRATMQDMLVSVRAEYAKAHGPIPEGEAWMPATLGGSAPTVERAALLEQEERERRQAEKERKRNTKLGRADRLADLKSNLALNSTGWVQRTKARAQLFLSNRREK